MKAQSDGREEGVALASIVLDDDPRRIVGPAEMHQLSDHLRDLGFDVRITTRHQVDVQERNSPRSPSPDALFCQVNDGVELVVEWVNAGLVGGVAFEAAKAVTKGWLATARGRRDSPRTTRDRSRVLARWHLWREFGEDFAGEDPIEERKEADGSWTIVFARPGVEAWAMVPPNVDQLGDPGSVRTARRVL